MNPEGRISQSASGTIHVMVESTICGIELQEQKTLCHYPVTHLQHYNLNRTFITLVDDDVPYHMLENAAGAWSVSNHQASFRMFS